MDILGLLVTKASEEGHLQPLSSKSLHHHISLYADDVVLFLRPAANDIMVLLDILNLFGDASGLRTNVQKSSVLPIQCTEEDMSIIQNSLPCEIHDFPIKYLGIPLSLKKLSRAQVQPIIDKIANQLSGWKADLMTRAGRVVQVQFLLTAMLVYLIMAIDLPPWAIKAIDKIRRGEEKKLRGGHCLITWNKVQLPKELGGLGISNLQTLGCTLRMRWLWLQKTEPDWPWSLFPIKLHKSVHAFLSMAVETVVWNGKQTLLWKDRWLHGWCLEDLAPKLFALVPKRRINRRTVHDALLNHECVKDIQGALSIEVILEFLDLADCLADFELQPDVLDSHIWRFSPSGQYSSKSAYENFFQGSISFSPWERIWNHGRLTHVSSSSGSLPTRDAGLQIDSPREICHTQPPVHSATKRKRRSIMRFNLQNLAPLPEDESLDGWWSRESFRVHDLAQRGFNSLVILGACTLWKHRNLCVFEGAVPNLARALLLAEEEAYLWVLAGAWGISVGVGRGLGDFLSLSPRACWIV
ncbi:hypothetical protein U9M48_035378 [Paspalum notatum var. saurae]|uniref:Reverse transcriptase domain-containing protein n=1 Tax=Paspalum notatum var. saurae TaxID=547442 RepID=A0AAQ3X7R8_PASNO